MAEVLADDSDDDADESKPESDQDGFEPGLLIGYRASELAHDEFCHAQDFGHKHAFDLGGAH